MKKRIEQNDIRYEKLPQVLTKKKRKQNAKQTFKYGTLLYFFTEKYMWIVHTHTLVCISILTKV